MVPFQCPIQPPRDPAVTQFQRFPKSSAPSLPLSRPGPPPPGAVPRPAISALGPPNVAPGRPDGPSVSQLPTPPPGYLSSSMGRAPVMQPASHGVLPLAEIPPSSGLIAPPLGSRPPSPFMPSPPLTNGSRIFPATAPGSLMNNGLQMGTAPGGLHFPLASSRSQPPARLSPGPFRQSSLPFSAESQGVLPFSFASQGMQSSPATPQASLFSVVSHGSPPTQGSPIGPQTWESWQTAPAARVPGSVQLPRIFGMSSALQNHSVTSIPPALVQSGTAVGSSKVDPAQIPRPIPNSPLIMHETRHGNQANPPLAAFLALKSTGGKLLVFQSVLPSVGIGALSAREAEGRSSISAGEKEAHKLLQPADKTLKTMAIEFAEYQVCVDIFLPTQTYVDIASISVIPETTGGQIDCNKTILVTLKHDDKLQDGAECAFQRAIEIPSTPLLQVQERVRNLCINTLLSYRKFCAAVSSTGQLILPEALRLLPLYTLALTKSIGLRTEQRTDDRSFWVSYVSYISTPLAVSLVHPRMLPINDLDRKEDGASVPRSIALSSENICDEGVYLLENGDDCLIYIGSSVSSDIMQQLLGISSVDEIPNQFMLQQYDNQLSKIRRERCSYLHLKLCRKEDPSGSLFFSYLVEDKHAAGPSYVEFLVYLHRQIQMKVI